MKRTPLRRKTRLKAGKPPQSKTPLRKSNPERKKRVRGDEVYGDFHRWIKTQPCVFGYVDAVHDCAGPVTGHHIKSVGAGGKDYANEVPVCDRAHNVIHTHGISARERTFLEALGRQYAKIYPGTKGEQ